MKARTTLGVVALGIILSACATAPQQPIPLSQATVSTKSTRIGVAMKPLPKVDTFFPGANCLLCLGAASIANSSLTSHTQTLPYEDLPELKNSVAELLSKKGSEVTVIRDPLDVDSLPSNGANGPNIAKKDFSSIKRKYQVDKLIVLEVNALGMERTYSAYFPTNAPTAVLEGKGYLVDLDSNKYEWYMPVRLSKGAEGNWDEPPKFPGLTNAYFSVLERAKDSFFQPFSN